MPNIDIELTKTTFNQDLSEEFKAHLLAFAEKYRPRRVQDPDDMPVLSKIRRQDRYRIYNTDNAYFLIDCSFFIENDKKHPHRCRFHFVDHSKHAEGHFGRVLFIFAILDLDLEQKSILAHKDAQGRALARIKAAKKTCYVDLLAEFKAMPKYSPADQNLNEEPYELFEVEGSDKKRLMMPDLGNTLDHYFDSYKWYKLPPENRLIFGNGQQLTLAEQLCRAVARLHEDGYVHKDIKPDNILIKKTGSGLFARLADYGAHSHKYEICSTHGAPLYRSGETFSTYTKRHLPSSDVYALCLNLLQWLFLNFRTIPSDSVTHHLKQYSGFRGVREHGFSLLDRKIIPNHPALSPLVDLLYQGFEKNPVDRPTALQLADCIRDVSRKIQSPSLLYTINLNKFNEEISEKFKEHFLTFIASYRPLSQDNKYLVDFVKIRRQDPYGTYQTKEAFFKIEHSFYIENLDSPDACRLYFIDHEQHIDGPNSRVGRCTLIVTVDLQQKKMLVNKIPPGQLSLSLIKCANKNKMGVIVNRFLEKEYYMMPKYSPSNPVFQEEKYSLCTVNGSSRKLRFFMPDKGIALEKLFISKDWNKLRCSSRIMLGNDSMSLIEQLCRQVAKLHEDGFVHRDIKPDNLLIKELNGQYNLCLANFGYCCPQDRVCHTYGTFIYLPFEISCDNNDKKHPASLDVYSLCVTIVQFIFCPDFNTYSQEVYDHTNTFCSYDAFEYDEIKYIDYIASHGLPPTYSPFIKLLSQGLSIDPEERPSAEQLADCIHELTETLKQSSITTPRLNP